MCKLEKRTIFFYVLLLITGFSVKCSPNVGKADESKQTVFENDDKSLSIPL